MSNEIRIPDPDPDAPVAHQHAAPVNLNGALPSEPSPSVQVRDEGDSMSEAEIAATNRRGQHETRSQRPRYESPEPIEAHFAQIRADLASQQKMLMLTATTVIFLSLLLAYTVRKGGFVVDG